MNQRYIGPSSFPGTLCLGFSFWFSFSLSLRGWHWNRSNRHWSRSNPCCSRIVSTLHDSLDSCHGRLHGNLLHMGSLMSTNLLLKGCLISHCPKKKGGWRRKKNLPKTLEKNDTSSSPSGAGSVSTSIPPDIHSLAIVARSPPNRLLATAWCSHLLLLPCLGKGRSVRHFTDTLCNNSNLVFGFAAKSLNQKSKTQHVTGFSSLCIQTKKSTLHAC